MTEKPIEDNAVVPLGQRIFEQPFLLLLAGLIPTLVLYTGWGAFELLSMQQAPLP